MAAQGFLSIVAGRIQQVLAILTSAGSGDANKIPALDATGKLDISFMPSGIGSTTITALASEALSAGNVVNLWNNSGTVGVRKADNTAAGKEANGFVLAGVSSGASATVYPIGNVITGLSTLTPGTRYYLGTSGAVVAAGSLPTATGSIVQCVGESITASTLLFSPEPPVTLA